jgi:hypothetical protein
MPGADAKADSEWLEVSLILVRKSASAGTELKRLKMLHRYNVSKATTHGDVTFPCNPF